jgi:hypothetical protein
MMRQHALIRWCAALLLASWGCVLGSCQPTVVGPTTPSGYRVVLPEASQTLRAHPLTLTVRVRDTAGQPVDEVLVHFHIPNTWAGRAQVDPPTVATRQGQATTTFRARTAGRMMVQVTVEDRTADIPITVLGDTPRF